MWAFCRRVEPDQAKFKVGYEARYKYSCMHLIIMLWVCYTFCRFGRIYWMLPKEYNGRSLPVRDVYKLKPRQIVPQ